MKDIFPGPNTGGPQFPVEANGTLYFTARNGEPPAGIWKSDGRAEGTALLNDLRGLQGIVPHTLTYLDGTLYFTGFGVEGAELWALPLGEGPPLRGDANADGRRNIADAIALLGCLFLGDPCPAGACVLPGPCS